MKDQCQSLREQTVLLEEVISASRRRLESGLSPSCAALQEDADSVRRLSRAILYCYAGEADALTCARALLALLDGFELSRDAAVLERALELAGALTERLPACPLKCKLLSYCYYYTEDERCAREAGRIVEGWGDTKLDSEMQEALSCYEALV